MDKLLLTALTTVCLLAHAGAQRDQQGRGQGRGQTRPVAKLENFTTEQVKFTTKHLRSGEAGYEIYLPKGYADEANKEKKYPWLCWLHGFGGNQRFGNAGGSEVIDKLLGEGKVPPMLVVVFIPPGGRSVYINGDRSGDIEDAIVKDLVADVEKKYRAKGGPENRALVGESMGGMAVLKIAMHHPEVFGVVGAHSAAILPADPAELSRRFEQQAQRMIQQSGLQEVFGDPIDKEKWATEMPLGLVAKKKPEELKSLKIYFDAGTEDRYGFAPPNEELHKALTAKGIPHVFRMVQGGGHAWGSPSMKENLAHSLQFVGKAFDGKDPVKEASAEKKESGDEKKGGAEKSGGNEKEGKGEEAKKEGSTGR